MSKVVPIKDNSAILSNSWATCGDCYHKVTEKDEGEESHTCYRYPPTAWIISDGGDHTPVEVRPMVDLDERACGEFKPKQ